MVGVCQLQPMHIMWLRLRDSYTERKDSTYYPRFLRAFILRKRESGMPVDEKSVINLVREKCC